MTWQKVGKRLWEARGAKGKFLIEQSGAMYWPSYVNRAQTCRFKLRPTRRIADAKALCENDAYWENEQGGQKAV